MGKLRGARVTKANRVIIPRAERGSPLRGGNWAGGMRPPSPSNLASSICYVPFDGVKSNGCSSTPGAARRLANVKATAGLPESDALT